MSEQTLMILALIWTLPWKGVALWKAARHDQTGWFVALLVFQTMALLEIIYLVFFQKDKNAKQGL